MPVLKAEAAENVNELDEGNVTGGDGTEGYESEDLENVVEEAEIEESEVYVSEAGSDDIGREIWSDDRQEELMIDQDDIVVDKQENKPYSETDIMNKREDKDKNLQHTMKVGTREPFQVRRAAIDSKTGLQVKQFPEKSLTMEINGNQIVLFLLILFSIIAIFILKYGRPIKANTKEQ